MNWSLIVGPGCLLASLLIALYVRDKAREVVKQEFATLIATSLALFKVDLIESLVKVYVRSGECNLMMDANDDRIDIAAKRLDTIDVRFDGLKHTPKRNS